MLFSRAGLILAAAASFLAVPALASEAAEIVARDAFPAETPAPVVADRVRRATSTTTRSGGTRTVTSTRRSSSTNAAEHFSAASYGQMAYVVGGIAAVGAALV